MTKNEISEAIAHDFATAERIKMIARIESKRDAKRATLERKSQRQFQSIAQQRAAIIQGR